ncbi:MAG: ABC transporter permease subunit [Polyangiales bacterium]
MTILDNRYEPYEGTRRDPSTNFGVLVAHDGSRAIQRLSVKLILLFSWLPAAGAITAALIYAYSKSKVEAVDSLMPFPAADTLETSVSFSTWTFVSWFMIVFGSHVLSGEHENRTIEFYLSKPVTVIQLLRR